MLDVVLLTRANCSLCDQARTLLDRLAVDYPLAVSTLDFDTPEGQALAERSGMLYVPGVFVGGQVVASGRVSDRQIRREIEQRLGISPPETRLPTRHGAHPASGRESWWRSVLGWLTRSW